MAETQLTNVIVPSVFTVYNLEPSIYKSRFWGAGVIQENPSLNALLSGGGTTFNLPFWKDTAGGTGDVPSESVATTINSATSGRQVARRQFREKAWGSNMIAGISAGEDIVSMLGTKAGDFWTQAYDQLSIASLRGVVADNIANDSGDLVNDISSLAGAAGVISDSAVIDAQAKLGENGTVSANDLNGGSFAAVLIHPLTYAKLRKDDAIDFVPISGQERPLEFYMGMRVIVDRNAFNSAGVYDSYILKNGALQFGQTSEGYMPTELFRDPSKGFGIDQIYTRRCFALHPVGFQWTENTVTGGITPSDANLSLAANWDRVYNAENSGLVVLRHKIA